MRIFVVSTLTISGSARNRTSKFSLLVLFRSVIALAQTIVSIDRKKEIPYKRACGGHRVHNGYTVLYEQGYEGVVSRDVYRHHPGTAMST